MGGRAVQKQAPSAMQRMLHGCGATCTCSRLYEIRPNVGWDWVVGVLQCCLQCEGYYYYYY